MPDISSTLRDDEILIDIGGVVNMDDVPGIRERIDRELELYSDKNSLVIDLTGMRYDNHHFLDMLLDYDARMCKEDKSLVIMNPDLKVHDVMMKYFSMMKERGVISEFPSIERDALMDRVDPMYGLF